MARRSMAEPPPAAVRRTARAFGWILFAAFELFIAGSVYVVASARCCNASGGAAPQSAAEWVALGLFAVTMLLLGASVGLGGALCGEGLIRLFGRVRKRCAADSGKRESRP